MVAVAPLTTTLNGNDAGLVTICVSVSGCEHMRTVGRIVLSETPMATRINSGGAKICRSVEYRNRTASFGTAGQVDRTCRINTVAVWRERRDRRRQWPRWRRLDRA